MTLRTSLDRLPIVRETLGAMNCIGLYSSIHNLDQVFAEKKASEDIKCLVRGCLSEVYSSLCFVDQIFNSRIPTRVVQASPLHVTHYANPTATCLFSLKSFSLKILWSEVKLFYSNFT